MLYTLLNPIIVFLSLSTAAGVFVHDMKIDKAVTALSVPPALTVLESGNKLSLSPDLHTHSERTSLSQAVNDLKSPSPRVLPRSHEDKKHLLQNNTPRGYHAFDNHNLPIV